MVVAGSKKRARAIAASRAANSSASALTSCLPSPCASFSSAWFVFASRDLEFSFLVHRLRAGWLARLCRSIYRVLFLPWRDSLPASSIGGRSWRGGGWGWSLFAVTTWRRDAGEERSKSPRKFLINISVMFLGAGRAL